MELEQETPFDFSAWKIGLDIRNQYAIVRSPSQELLLEVIERFPSLKGLVADVLFDGLYVLLDHEKLESLDPFVYDGIPLPFKLRSYGECNWSLWRDKKGNNKYEDLIVYEGVEYRSGNFSSVQSWIKEKPMRINLMENMEKTKQGLEENKKDLEKLTKSKDSKSYDIEWKQERVDTFTDSLQKMRLFLDEADKKISYREYGQFVKIVS